MATPRRVLEAQADADAQHLLTSSLTPLYVQFLLTQKWNGALPQYQLGGSDSGGLGTLLSIPVQTPTAAPTVQATPSPTPGR